MKTEKIGLGIVTCNRPEFVSKCIESIDLKMVDEKVIVNDGTIKVDYTDFFIINNVNNFGLYLFLTTTSSARSSNFTLLD